MLPVMSKCFSGILLRRLRGTLESSRTPEEMGFRKNYSCSDLIHVLRLVGEKSVEWGECVWLASLDMEKAFDKIIHTSMQDGLVEAGVDECTINAARRIYADQYGYVQLDPGLRSRYFFILRGVRQGDPLSPNYLRIQ
jgi:hypothetical protein